MTNSKNTPRRDSGRGVRGAYTFSQLKNDVQAVYRAKDRQNSLRALSKKYGVSHAAIQRVLAGIEPKRPDIRQAFKLTDMQPAPVCPKHGVVHKGQCPRKKTFEQNAADYSDWMKVNAGKLAEWVGEYQSRTEQP